MDTKKNKLTLKSGEKEMDERNTKENLGGNKIKEFQIGKVGIFLILIQTENGFTNIPKLNIIQNIIRS